MNDPLYDLIDMKRVHIQEYDPDYRKARGIIPWKIGDELPEDAIGRLRGNTDLLEEINKLNVGLPHEVYMSRLIADPEYIDEILDPLRAARGLMVGVIISILFWGTLIGIVALANHYLGGG